MGPTRSPHRLPSLAPTARRHADGCPCCTWCCTWIHLRHPRAVFRYAVVNFRKKLCVTTNQRNQFVPNNSHLIQIKTLLIFIKIKRNLASMSDIARIKKQHSLIESVALKAPKELLYCSSTPYAISRRWRRVSTNASVKSYASITALISP